MKVFIYASNKYQSLNTVEAVAKPSNYSASIDVKIEPTLTQVANELCRPLSGYSMVILFLGDQDNLNHILKMKLVFKDKKLIIVLPDDYGGKKLLVLALNPTYVCNINRASQDIPSIINKLLHKNCSTTE